MVDQKKFHKSWNEDLVVAHFKFNSFDLMVNYGCVCSVASLALKHLQPSNNNSLNSRYCTSYLSHKTGSNKGSYYWTTRAADGI